MASPSTVLTLGVGSFGSVNLLPTLGYGAGASNNQLRDRWANVIRLNTDPQGRLTTAVAANRSELLADHGRIE